MESRSAWTDERLDDRFDHIDSELTQLRIEMREGFGEAHRRTDSLGVELRGEIDALRVTILRVGGAMMAGLVGVIAAVLVRGA